jgi:molybdate transport repressor ModE-like protein
MNDFKWDQLRILKTVIETGSLSAAARHLGMSQPTVGRQIHALETSLNMALVDTTPLGTAPTAYALSLMPALDDMTTAVREIFIEQLEYKKVPTVRVACGSWVSVFLCQNADMILNDSDSCSLEIASSADFTDLPKREADIAIRNKRPEHAHLRIKRLPPLVYAAYGSKSLVTGQDNAFDKRRFLDYRWVGLTEEFDNYSSSQWLAAKLNAEPAWRCNSPINLMHTVESGQYLALLPCFAADKRPTLRRISAPITLDKSALWMVMASDVHRRPAVRCVANRLADLFAVKKASFIGISAIQ